MKVTSKLDLVIMFLNYNGKVRVITISTTRGSSHVRKNIAHVALHILEAQNETA